ncbi:MAG: FtsH protease activity modulator HflK [Dehalococcoidia bacterium]
MTSEDGKKDSMYGERRPEFDPDQFIRNLRQSWDNIRARLPGGGRSGLLIVGGLIVIIVLWAASGFYTVGPTEQAATRLFGKFQSLQDQGLHWFPPSPIGRVDVEAVDLIQTMELGFRSEPARDVQIEAEMITGDLNIVDVQLVVQYRIKDLKNFLFNVGDPGDPDRDASEGRPDGRTLKDATEAALRQVIGQRSIDDPLRVAKVAVQDATKTLLQEILDEYESGIEIVEVQLQTVRPPDIVRDAFDDVNRARVDKETVINEALAYEQDQIPRANGAAAQIVQAAEAFKLARVARANGEAQEFLAVLAEYEKSQDVTRQRLYLEAMEDILPGITIFVIDEGAGSGVLPFLPLTNNPPPLPGTGQ